MTQDGKFENAYYSVYQALLEQHNIDPWWPADTRFEIMLGAILTQNTAWTNVQKAIKNLQQAKLLEPQAISDLPDHQLADLIRPSGYFNLKTRRLKNYCDWFLQAGGIARLSRLSTKKLREQLLAVNGIGPETADDILLYAFDRPVFVIDAYTRRIFSRLGLLSDKLKYEQMRDIFESELDRPEITKSHSLAQLYGEYHALIDTHAASICKKQPDCLNCALKERCQNSPRKN